MESGSLQKHTCLNWTASWWIRWNLMFWWNTLHLHLCLMLDLVIMDTIKFPMSRLSEWWISSFTSLIKFLLLIILIQGRLLIHFLCRSIFRKHFGYVRRHQGTVTWNSFVLEMSQKYKNKPHFPICKRALSRNYVEVPDLFCVCCSNSLILAYDFLVFIFSFWWPLMMCSR